MILPIPKLVKEAKRRGIKTIIDGAHVPAHIELDIKTLDPDYYIGACHKWLCSPKGVSFLYVKKDLQKNIQPQVMSWGWGEEYDEFKSSTQHKTKSRFLNIFLYSALLNLGYGYIRIYFLSIIYKQKRSTGYFNSLDFIRVTSRRNNL